MDWGLVGGDPAPGDANAIAALANDARRAGDDASSAQRELEQVRSSTDQAGWTGATSDRYRDQTSDLSPRMGTLARALTETGAALSWYAQRLRDYQATANAALHRAWEAEQRRRPLDQQRGQVHRRQADLLLQLGACELDEKAKWAHLQTARLVPGSDVDARRAYDQARSTTRAVQEARAEAQREEDRLDRLIDAQQAIIDAARATVRQVKADRWRDERTARAWIEEHLPEDAKPGIIDRLLGFLGIDPDALDKLHDVLIEEVVSLGPVPAGVEPVSDEKWSFEGQVTAFSIRVKIKVDATITKLSDGTYEVAIKDCAGVGAAAGVGESAHVGKGPSGG